MCNMKSSPRSECDGIINLFPIHDTYISYKHDNNWHENFFQRIAYFSW